MSRKMSRYCLRCGEELKFRPGRGAQRTKYCSINCNQKYLYHNNINGYRDKVKAYCHRKSVEEAILNRERTKFLKGLSPEELLREVGYYDSKV